MREDEKEIWDTIDRHLRSIFSRDVDSYRATTAEDLSLYEWFITPHRQDGLPFHLFMIEHGWAGDEGDLRFDLWEKRLQLYGDTAIASYSFMLTKVIGGAMHHQTHNESRVLIRGQNGWKIVHVHKSPAWNAPLDPPE